MHFRTLGLMAVLFVGGWALAQTPMPVMNKPALPPTAVAPPGVPTVPGGGPTYPAVPSLGSTPYLGAAANCPPVIPADAVQADAGGSIIYGGAEYILWQIRKGNIPMSASTAPVGLIAVDTSDLVTFSPTGQPFTQGTPSQGVAAISIFNEALFGGGPYTNIGGQNGGRFTLGFWADPDMSWGVEAQFAFLERGSDAFVATSSQQGNQFTLDTGFTQSLFLVGGTAANPTRTLLSTFDIAVPREVTSALAGTANASLYTGEVNGRTCCFRIGGCDVGGLIGFRYLNLNEGLYLLNNVNLVRPESIPVALPDLTSSLSENFSIITSDRTRIYNHFFGGQVGADFDWKFGACFINTRVKGAVGLMHQIADIQSTTNVINNDPARPGAPESSSSQGGLLAAPGQNGRVTRDRFGFIPEVNVKLGYQFTDWLRGHVGYDGLVIVNAARPGGSVVISQLSTTVNAGTSAPVNININQPNFKFRDQDVWVQGVSFGLEARY